MLKVTLDKPSFQCIAPLSDSPKMLKISHARHILKTPFLTPTSPGCYTWGESLHLQVEEEGKIGIEILEKQRQQAEDYLRTVLQGQIIVHGYDKGNRSKTIDIRDLDYNPMGKLTFMLMVTSQKKTTLLLKQAQKQVRKADSPVLPKDSLDSAMEDSRMPTKRKGPGKLRISSIIGNLKEPSPSCTVLLRLKEAGSFIETIPKKGSYPVWMNVLDLNYGNEEELEVILRNSNNEDAKGVASLSRIKLGHMNADQSVFLRDQKGTFKGELFLDIKFRASLQSTLKSQLTTKGVNMSMSQINRSDLIHSPVLTYSHIQMTNNNARLRL